MKKLIMALAAILYCCAHTVQAQSGSLQGTVTGNNNQPLEFVAAALHRLPDSVIEKSAFSDSTGAFILDHLKEGSYFLELFSAGFKNWKSEKITITTDNPSIQIPAVAMQPAANTMTGVEVSARKNFVVRKADRTVVNVDALISAAGLSALEVLEKSPGVQVDQNGKISLRGKQGVAIYINDKPTYLSGDDLANYLRSLPSSTLDQIELMTNPPANYDAAGSAGIINIKTKKNGIKGFNGSLNLGLTQGQLTRSNNSLNLNYRNNKLNTYVNLSYGLQNTFADLDLNRTYKDATDKPNAYFEQNSYFRTHGDAVNLVAGADFYQSDKNTFGIVLTGMGRQSAQLNDNTSNVLNGMHLPDSIIVAHNRDESTFLNGGINLNYRRQIDQNGHGFTVDADYLTYRNHTDQAYKNTGYRRDHTLQSEDLLTGKLPSDLNIYSLKADYTRPDLLKFKLVAGVKFNYTATDNTADYSVTVNDLTQPDYGKSNRFTYKENINAAYLSLSRETGKIAVQAGLRLENTIMEGHQLGNVQKPDSSFSRNYTNLFPTFYFSYKSDSQAKHQLNINYGRRINRPYYQDMNPFLYPMDKFTYYVGNPFLKPSFINSIELSYIYKTKFSATFSYSKSEDDVSETIEINNGIYYSRPGNIGSNTTTSLALDGDFDPAKWLNLHVYSELGHTAAKSDFYSGTLNTSGNYWYISGNIRITAGKGWNGELSGNYRTKLYVSQFILGDIWGMNIAVQKKMSAKATLKFSVNDIFYTQINTGVIGNLAQTDANWRNKNDSRFATLSFIYRFGKTFSSKEKYAPTGADAEKNRVKN